MSTESITFRRCGCNSPFDHADECVYSIAYAQSLAAAAGISFTEAQAQIRALRGRYPVRVLS